MGTADRRPEGRIRMETFTDGNTTISFSVSGNNCCIMNSWRYAGDDSLKRRFVLHLRDRYPDFAHGMRSVDSYVREWKAHNVLYRWGIFPDSTGDTDLSIRESALRRLGYLVISTLFRERKRIL